MRFLLDTLIPLRALGDLARLNASTRSILADPAHPIAFSAASIWEIAIKARFQHRDFGHRPEAVAHEARTFGYTEPPITADVAARVADLPLHHRDPFDRLLVAQAMASPMRLFTANAVLLPYSELVTYAG